MHLHGAAKFCDARHIMRPLNSSSETPFQGCTDPCYRTVGESHLAVIEQRRGVLIVKQATDARCYRELRVCLPADGPPEQQSFENESGLLFHVPTLYMPLIAVRSNSQRQFDIG